jgi:serine protease Do
MRNHLLIAMVLVPLLAIAAAPEQRYDPEPEAFGFSSDEAGTGSYLGIDMADISAERLSALKLKKEQGVEVTMVDQDAPAGKAGIHEHDVILSLNGTAIESGAQLRRIIHETPPGRVVSLGLSRDGQPLSLQVKLGERASKFAFKMPPMPRTPAIMQDMDIPVSVVVVHSALRSGLMIENLTPQLGEFFGAKDGHGVLVRSVERGSRAEKAGFRAGDVIVRVDKEPVHDASDFSSALRSHRSSGSVAIGLIREKKEQTITLTLPQPKESGDLFAEESFAFPNIDINASIDLQDLATELNDFRPEMLLADIKPQIDMAMKQARQGAEEARKELRKHQKELEQQQRELKKQMHEQSRQLQHEMKKHQQEIQRELRELQAGNFEI